MDHYIMCRAELDLDLGPEPLIEVASVVGTEQVSNLFRFEIEVGADRGSTTAQATAADQLDLEAVVGHRAHLTISAGWMTDLVDGGEQQIHGMVSRFEQGIRGEDFSTYRATLVPRVWVLTQRTNCRIFQNEDVTEIVTAILDEHGFASDDDFKFVLSEQPATREYCVQYRETDFDFVSRLLEEEGIFYFFEHTDGKDVLVMGNEYPVHPDIGKKATIPFRASPSLMATSEGVFDFTYGHYARPSAIRLRDWNFEQPDLKNEGSLEVRLPEDDAEAPVTEEVYLYPGRYRDPEAEGASFVQARFEQLTSTKAGGRGASTCVRFRCGHVFQLDGFYRADLDQRYMLQEVHHEIHAGGEDDAETKETHRYRNRFGCGLRDTPYRPPAITPKPVMNGVQTALVVGPKGEEIYTDERSRVKVKFHWDRSDEMEEPTCWIRVGQTWAGAAYGTLFIPRIGHEVIVAFEDGDPDRPLITGSVYYEAPPTSLPKDRTQSTLKSKSSPDGDGHNELRFEDKKGKEEIVLHGEKDWQITIKNDKQQTVGQDETLDVARDRKKTIGKNENESIGENRSISVGKDHTESIGKNLTLTVGGDVSESVDGKQTVQIGKNLSVTVSGSRTDTIDGDAGAEIGGSSQVSVAAERVVTAKKITIEAKDELVLKCGDATIKLDKKGNIKIVGKGELLLDAGKDMSIVGKKSISVKPKKDFSVKASGNAIIKGKKAALN